MSITIMYFWIREKRKKFLLKDYLEPLFLSLTLFKRIDTKLYKNVTTSSNIVIKLVLYIRKIFVRICNKEGDS